MSFRALGTSTTATVCAALLMLGSSACSSKKASGGASSDAGGTAGHTDAGGTGKSDAGSSSARSDAAVADSGAADGGKVDGAVAAPTDSGVDSGVDSGASNALGDPTACAVCDQAIPSSSGCYRTRDACLTASGNAARGPKASAPKSELCTEVLACFWKTGCANTGQWSDCLCGKNVDCFNTTAPAAGACKDELFAASESTDLNVVNNRFYDTSYAVGLALQVVDCDAISCGFECKLCTPAAGSGPSGDANCHPHAGGSDAGY
jgi:hypothetical protein